jgi:hypothetical protein
MSSSINFVTKLKEILLIAEVNGDGGNTPGYNSTADIFKYVSVCVALCGLGFLGVFIIYIRSKQIF